MVLAIGTLCVLSVFSVSLNTVLFSLIADRSTQGEVRGATLAPFVFAVLLLADSTANARAA
jgi:hypothetical protein